MVQLLRPRSLLGLGVGVLAVAMLQGEPVRAQGFAWHGPQTFYTGVIGNPSLAQATPGTYGTTFGNFELVVPLRTGGIGHFFRNNDDPSFPWSGPVVFAADQGQVDAVSLVLSNFTSSGIGPGNLAVVARVGNELLAYFREDVAFTWSGATTIASGVTGVPSFVQARPGTYGSMGNYELVTPLRSGGIAHFFRNNDDSSLPWTQTATFGTDLGVVDAVSLVQTNLSTQFNNTGVQGQGNLAVIARRGNDLYYFFRTDDPSFTWSTAQLIASGVTGNPSFVQAKVGTYGTIFGNYELAVPLRTGGIGWFFRDNDNPSFPWTGPVTFGTSLGAVDGVSLIQSNLSSQAVAGGGTGPGNLIVVSVTGNEMDYFYRDDF